MLLPPRAWRLFHRQLCKTFTRSCATPELVTVWSIFPATTKYFEPTSASFMLNYIVDDLEALLDRLAKEGVRIDPKRQDESYGRFAWIYDPDGNKIELWQPLKRNQ